ncbi:MAG: hypothetical protein ACXACB_00065 [Promethearchaeota archaeon]
MAKPIVFARMPKHDVELLKKVSKARGEDLSDFVRRAIYRELGNLSFLSDEQKKALGIGKKENQNGKRTPL